MSSNTERAYYEPTGINVLSAADLSFICEDDVVLVHDDLLATGGTMAAACRLVGKMSPKKIYGNVLINLTACPRVPVFPEDLELTSIIDIDID